MGQAVFKIIQVPCNYFGCKLARELGSRDPGGNASRYSFCNSIFKRTGRTVLLTLEREKKKAGKQTTKTSLADFVVLVRWMDFFHLFPLHTIHLVEEH